MKTVLTIAGSDCSGGAGIQADLKTIAAHGLYGMSAITALTAQNTLGVFSVFPVPADFFEEQLHCIFSDIRPDAVKIGMIPNEEIMHKIVKMLEKEKVPLVVADPVMASTSGRKLAGSYAEAFFEKLFSLTTLITPNLDEAAALTGKEIKDKADMERVAEELAGRYQTAVLLKGGHLINAADDYCYDGKRGFWLSGEKINNPNTHGTGCTLSSAIAANLAVGDTLEQAVKKAKEYITGAIRDGLNLGAGNGPLNHMYQWTGIHKVSLE